LFICAQKSQIFQCDEITKGEGYDIPTKKRTKLLEMMLVEATQNKEKNCSKKKQENKCLD
jgi:hypothetical protein